MNITAAVLASSQITLRIWQYICKVNIVTIGLHNSVLWFCQITTLCCHYNCLQSQRLSNYIPKCDYNLTTYSTFWFVELFTLLCLMNTVKLCSYITYRLPSNYSSPVTLLSNFALLSVHPMCNQLAFRLLLSVWMYECNSDCTSHAYTNNNIFSPQSVLQVSTKGVWPHGSLQSLDWTSGLDWWTGLVDWHFLC